jgi:hypothetical protein
MNNKFDITLDGYYIETYVRLLVIHNLEFTLGD